MIKLRKLICFILSLFLLAQPVFANSVLFNSALAFIPASAAQILSQSKNPFLTKRTRKADTISYAYDALNRVVLSTFSFLPSTSYLCPSTIASYFFLN
jgi:hypothetical protein